MKKLQVVVVLLVLSVGFASMAFQLVWDPSPTPNVDYKLYAGPDLNTLTVIYAGEDVFYYVGDWPAVKTVFTTTSVEQNPPHRESGQSNSLTVDPLYRANVLGESTGVLVFTDTGGTETKVYEGGVGTYTFYTITSEPPPGEVQPPGGVGVGGS